jgi:channel protein (hemolysin III family)
VDNETISIPGFTEPISSLTHLVGAGAFAIIGLVLIFRGRGNWARVVSLTVYVFSCVLLLSMSGVYHLLAFNGAGRAVLARLDHAAIFVFIAGTFTPAHVILFRGPGRWGMLLAIWGVAAAGVTLKTVFFTDTDEWLGLASYLAMGWLGIISGTALWRKYGRSFVRPLFWGGCAYTVGAVLDFLRWPILYPGVLGAHEAFHIAVLIGAALHFRFIWQFAPGWGQENSPEASQAVELGTP